MGQNTGKSKTTNCCAMCAHCNRIGRHLVCMERSWLLRLIMGVQYMPAHGFCNRFKRLATQRTR